MQDFKFAFERRQISKIPHQKIIEELERVANAFNYTDFKQDDFDELSEISHFTVNREFGSWNQAMQFLEDHFNRKGIKFTITTRRSSYTVQEMFEEMEKIWVKLGHRPSRNEWTAVKHIISYDSIYRRFGGWTNACLKFIEHKSGGTITANEERQTEVRKNDDHLPSVANSDTGVLKTKKIERTRTIPLNLRVRVLSRDNFRCVFCGKSPATDIGVKLHIDHVIPFTKGGANVLSNLRTLCQECNLGKSDTLV